MRFHRGDKVDHYTLLSPLGEGGQGSVWRVHDPRDGGVERALKLVSLDEAGPASFDRARREATILAAAQHPTLVACHGLFEDPRRAVVGLVMDLAVGQSLDEAARDGRFDRSRAMAVFAHLAGALAYIHEARLAHRDLKPENVIVTDAFWEAPHQAGTVKLVDFGIAASTSNATKLTATGAVIGTLPYLAPELVDPATWGKARGATRDVFAFGVMVYQILCGKHPTGLGPQATMIDYARAYKAAEAGRIPWPPAGLGGSIGAAVAGCLALRSAARPANGTALLALMRLGPAPTSTRASDRIADRTVTDRTPTPPAPARVISSPALTTTAPVAVTEEARPAPTTTTPTPTKAARVPTAPLAPLPYAFTPLPRAPVASVSAEPPPRKGSRVGAMLAFVLAMVLGIAVAAAFSGWFEWFIPAPSASTPPPSSRVSRPLAPSPSERASAALSAARPPLPSRVSRPALPSASAPPPSSASAPPPPSVSATAQPVPTATPPVQAPPVAPTDVVACCKAGHPCDGLAAYDCPPCVGESPPIQRGVTWLMRIHGVTAPSVKAPNEVCASVVGASAPPICVPYGLVRTKAGVAARLPVTTEDIEAGRVQLTLQGATGVMATGIGRPSRVPVRASALCSSLPLYLDDPAHTDVIISVNLDDR